MPMAATCGVSGARRESARRMAEQFGRPVEEDRSPIQYRDTYPFFDALELDTAGNLWVRVPAPAGAGGATMPRTWQVFDADGAWLGAVETPAGLRVTEIGDAYLLGVVRDDFDVEYVRMYRLERGSVR
jgi:hypothetical protein